MRRIAANKTFISVSGNILLRTITEIGEDAFVVRCFSFEREMNATEWFPGLIVLSPISPESFAKESGSFSDFASRLSQASLNQSLQVCKAYLISPFDLLEMRFLPSSRVSALG